MHTGINRYSTQHVEFSLSGIDYTRTGPLVTSRIRSDICTLFFGSDVLPCLTSNNLETTYDTIIKAVFMHSA